MKTNPQQETEGKQSESAKLCPCIRWCRTEPSPNGITNHHPLCEHYNDSLIEVWRVSYGGASYVTEVEPDYDDMGDGETVKKEKMHREIYEQLPEFWGF